MSAWKKKLKGITVYRDGSRSAILATDEVKTPFQEAKDRIFEITREDGSAVFCKGEEILKLPDGSLTTVYHYLNRNSAGIDDFLHSSKDLEEVK